jgi:hypothetical protein
MNKDQANTIVRYYDRKYTNEVHYETFVTDICAKLNSILQFTELSARTIKVAKKALMENPFIQKPFKTMPNKVLEKFKRDALNILDAKVASKGGSKGEWLKEAFKNWDPRNVGVVRHWEHLQGAIKRLGLGISQDDAECLMKAYDTAGLGQANYYMMIMNVSEPDPHFLSDATFIDSRSHNPQTSSVTSRTPSVVIKGIVRIGCCGPDPNEVGSRLMIFYDRSSIHV